MSDGIQELLGQIELRERAEMEENIRFNTERRMIESLAPDKWNALKESIKATLLEMRPLHLQHTETASTLVVSRFKGGVAVRTLTLAFDSSIPRISWCCFPPRKTGSITFSLQVSTLFYVANDAVRTEDEVVAVLLSCLTG